VSAWWWREGLKLRKSHGRVIRLFACPRSLSQTPITMKVTVKTTQQKTFQASAVIFYLFSLLLSFLKVDIEPTDSIADLKAKIEQEHKHPVAAQKIIYSGISSYFPSICAQ
jgi:hypothetical protein